MHFWYDKYKFFIKFGKGLKKFTNMCYPLINIKSEIIPEVRI